MKISVIATSLLFLSTACGMVDLPERVLAGDLFAKKMIDVGGLLKAHQLTPASFEKIHFLQRNVWNFSVHGPHVIIFDINGVILDGQGNLIPECKDLLQKCAQAGHTIMILSNGGLYTIGKLFIHYYDEILKYVKPDHILIPDITKKMKPSKDAYKCAHEVISKMPCFVNKKPLVFFIDDTKVNVDAARNNGMYGLHLKNNNYKAIECELKILGVLPR